jgi:DNA (cytosine-5)-methyltransferase 1
MRKKSVRYIDLFCGVGGFRLAMEQAAAQAGLRARCVFSCDIDDGCRRVYEANFGERPSGDISQVSSADAPDHDVLLAGFPCQPFSIIGRRHGFTDTRGTLFFEIARILDAKRPAVFVLENVKQLVGHDKGRTMKKIMDTLEELGYDARHRVFNALHFGLPQKRERTFIVGFREKVDFVWPAGGAPMKPLKEILESNPPKEHFASDYIRQKRLSVRKPASEPTIWHENKAGNVSAHPFSCALRAGASYNYLLVDGERRLTPREMFRLQGFPDTFRIVGNHSQTRKQAGNSLPVPVAQAVICAALQAIGWPARKRGRIKAAWPLESVPLKAPA